MTLQEMSRRYDPDDLARALARLFAKRPPTGFILGYNALRDAVADVLGCSALEGEQVVDVLIRRGRLVFARPSDDVGAWTFCVPDAN